MSSLRAPRRSVVAIVVASLVGALAVVISPATAALASPGDRIAPVVDAGTTYTQSFARSDGPVGLTYTLSGTRISQSAPSTALMTSRGTTVGYSPTEVGPSTGALINNTFLTDCAGGTATATDCGQNGTIKIDFDSPVTNPTIHVSGLGGSQTVSANNYANFATYLNLTASTSSTATVNSAVFDSIIGTATNLQLTSGGRLQTTGLRPGNSCDDNGNAGATSVAGCGSVLVSGTNLTSITLTLGLRNSGAATKIATASGPVFDAFLLDVSIPDNAPALANFQCTANSIYGLDQNDGNINRIDVGTGAETFIGHINAAAGTDLNGLAIKNGGGAAYAIKRTVTPGGSTTIYRLDPTTNTTTSYAGPKLTQTTSGTQIVEGAINPANGIYYFALIGGAGVEIYGFNTDTNTPVVGRIARLSGFSGINGDFAFDRAGRLILTSSTGNGSATANPLIYVNQPLPSTGNDAALVGQIVGYLQPNGAIINGMAYDLPQGYLYTNSSSSGQSILHQVNPTSGADIATRPVTYLGQTTNEVFDLGSCNYNNSIQLQKDIVSRANPTDQFTVSVTGGGINVGQSGTTSGSSAGVQTSLSATAGPIPALAGTTYGIKEIAGNGSTDLTNYITTWRCVNLLDPGINIASGTGPTGSVAIPTPTDADGIPLGCYFRNVAIASSISIVKTTDQTAYRVGDTVTYTIKVTNTGNTTLTGVAVADPTTASCVKSIGTLLAGASSTYTCTATAPVTGDSNTANVSGKDTLNKTVTATSTVPVAVIRPAITLVKTASPSTVTTVGQAITYSFKVTNSGDSTITALTIADSPITPSGPAPTITCPVTTLTAGASTTCTGAYSTSQADVDNGTIKNNAVANSKDQLANTVTSNQSSATVAVTQTGSITLTKTATPTTIASVGATVSYGFTVRNTGNVTITNIALTDVFDNANVGPPNITCPSTTLAPGASVRCTATYTSTQSDFDQGSINNTAQATGKNPAGGTVTSPTSLAAVTASTTPSISLVKTVTPTTITAAGQTVTYSFAVINTGNQTLKSLSIADTFTAPAGPVPAIACLATTLAPGASTTCSGTYVATQDDVNVGSIKNSAIARSIAPNGTTVNSAQSTAIVTVTQTSKLSLTKTANPTTITAAGQTVTYSFVVTNTGNVTVAALTIADTFATPAGPVPTITCPSTTLTPGQAATCTGTYVAQQFDVDNGTIKNLATALGLNPVGNSVSSPVANATVTVTRSAKLSLVKSANPVIVSAVNQSVGYSFLVTNTGNQTLSALSVTDTLTAPAGPPLTITCLATTLAPGANTTCTAIYKTSQADLDNGVINNSAVAKGTDPTNASVNSNTSTAVVTATNATALTLTKTANPTTYNAVNQSVNYSFVVTNSGNTTLTGVGVNDPMFVGANAAVCPVTTLAPGASTTCTATYRTAQADLNAGKVVNVATASGKDPKNATVTSNTATATITAVQTATLSLVKSVTPGTITAAGNTVSYSFAVTNTGNVTITGLAIVDTLTAPAGPVPAISCPVTTLEPGASTTCTSAAYVSTQTDINNGSINNSAVATGKNTGNGTVTSNTSSASVATTPTAKLTLLKVANPTTISTAGATVTYTFTVTNSGNVTVTGLAIADTLTAPAGPELGIIGCLATTLAPGASTTCSATYTATQADVNNGSIKNSAVASGKSPTNTTVTSNNSAAAVTVTQSPALTLTKTPSPTTITAAGQAVAYSFVVKNTGNVTLASPSVADTFVSPAGPEITPNCPSGPLAPGASITCSANYVSTQADVDNGTIKNTATALAKDPSGSTVVSPVANATVNVTRTPALTVVKAASPSTVTAAGQIINYTFTATNTGNVTLSLLNIADTLTAPAAPVPTVACPGTTIAPTAIVVCTASYTVSQTDLDAGSISNSAVAKATDPAGNPITSPPSTATVGTTRAATLQLTKSVAPTTVTTAGQSVTYTFTVKNTGNVTAASLAINDTFTAPAGPALSPITCASATLAPNATTICTASYSVSQADVDNASINNSAVATAVNPQGAAITSNTSTAVVTATAAPSLSLTKSASPVTFNAAGQTITYTFTVKNTGNVAITSVAVSDAQLSTAATCVATALAPAATTTCTGTHTVSQDDVDAGKIVNTATATGKSPTGSTVTSPIATATVTSSAAPSLSLTKSAAPTTVTASSQTVVYTFVVKNTGAVTVKSVSITDRFTAPAGPVPAITCVATTLAPGVSTTCTALAYSVTQADIDNGSIANNANANGLDPSNAPVTSNTADATVAVTQTPAITIVKSVNPTSATRAGQTVAYSFAVKNTGNVTLTSIRVNDSFTAPASPALNITCPATALAPSVSTICTAAYAVSQADVDAGVINNSATATGTTPGATQVTSSPSTAAVTIAAGPSLALLKTASPATYNAPDATITYSFKVTNTGTVTASTVAIVDPMFTGTNAPTCPVTTLAPNASTTCTAAYVTTQTDVDAGKIVNTATATATAPAGGQITSAPSSATVSAVQTPSLRLLKSATPQTVVAVGDTVTYSFTLTNTGNVTLSNAMVSDVFAPPASGDAVNCPDTTLSPGEIVVCTLNYDTSQADFDKGTINNTATANGVTPAGANAASNPSSAVVTATQTPGLALVKAASPTTVTAVGQFVTYSFTVTNNGTVTVHGLSIADTFTTPAGPAITPVCDSLVLVSGAVTTCTATYPVTQADLDNGTINNSAAAVGLDPGNASVASPPSTATVDTDTSAELTIGKSAIPTTISAAGTIVTYSFQVTNSGTTTLTNVKVVDALLPGASAAICAGGNATTGPTLAPGAVATCTGTYAATQSDMDNGKIVNTASATGKDRSGNTITSPPATATVTATQTKTISIVKSATVANPLTGSGQAVGYSIKVTNTGNVTLTSVSVADVLVPPAGPALSLTCPANRTLAPGEFLTCTAPYTTTQADVDNGSVNNSASATGTDPSGGLVPSSPSTASVPIAPVTALSLVKSVSPTTAAVGARVTYSFAVTNNSNVTISGLAIVDAFTAPATPVPTITCPVTSLAPGAATICTGNYTIKQADGDKGLVDNSATATGKTPAGASVTSNQSSAQVTVPQTASLTIVKSADPITVDAIGQTVSYSFKVTNTGTTTLSAVAVNDTFTAPAGPALSITCPVTTLAPNGSTTCSATYVVTQGDLDKGSINNVATATAKNPAGATITSPQSTATVTATQTASLSLVKSASPTTVTASGQTVNYSFKITNTGTVTISNLTISDAFTPPAGPVPSVTCTVTTLAPGGSTTCTASYSATQPDIDAGSIKNSATASGTDPTNRSVTSNPSVATVAVIQTAALTVTKTAQPTAVTAAGQSVTYRFEVTNTGSVTLSNVTINDQFTAPGGPVPTITCPSSMLAPGTSTICTATYATSQADVDNGVINNSATVTAKDPAGASVTSNLSTATVTAVRNATLLLAKSALPTTVTTAGQIVAYSFEVTNTGNTSITGLSIADTFTAPAGPELAVACPRTALAPGASTTCFGSYAATQADVDRGRIDNAATATGVNPQGLPVVSNQSTATVTAPPIPSLSLTKSVNVSTVTNIARAVTYSFKVTNTGNTTLTGVKVADIFTAPAGPELTVVCPVKTLAPGESTICSADYTVTAADFDTGSINNTARASGIDPANATILSNLSSAVITTSPQPSISLVKKATVTDVNQNGLTDRNDTILWTFTVTNTGNVTLSGLIVNDVTAGTATCDTPILAAKASTTCVADVAHVISQADVDAGSVNNTATTSGTDPFGTTVTSLPSSTSTPIDTTSTLTIVKTASPSTITAAGQTVTYSFTVTNTGNQTITGIAVTDRFTAPAGPALAITCPQITITAGESTVCTATYTPTQADVDKGAIDNTAAATGKNPAGNTVSAPPSTATVTATRTPSLRLVKSAAPTLVTTAGQSVTYSFKVTNTGNVTVDNLSIADTLTAPAGPALVVECPDVRLAPAASTTCTATYSITQADVDNGTVKNTATANGTNPQGGAVVSNESNATVTANPAGALTLTKSAIPTTVTTAGQTVNYSFLVRNSGNVTITGLAINDTFTAPAGPALAISCPVGSLAPGATTTCTAAYKVTQADIDNGSVNNSATVSGKDPSGTTTTSPPSTATVPVAQTPALTLVKSATPTTVTAAGDKVTYNFLITNNGNVTISNLSIADTLTPPAAPGLTVICPISQLAPKGSTTCTATYTINQDDVNKGTVQNTATASGTDPNGILVPSNPSSVTVMAKQTSTLTVAKSASPTTVTSAGQTVTYSFLVTNTGNTTVTDVAVADVLTAPAGPELTVTCPVTLLEPQGTTTCTATYAVRQSDLDSGAITNAATVSGTPPNGTPITSPPSTAVVSVTQTPTLTVLKTASPTTVTAAGDIVTYGFLVTNTGNTTVANLSIQDTFSAPAGPMPTITCPSRTLAPSGVVTCTATYSTTQADVDKGRIDNSAVATGTSPLGASVTSGPSTAMVVAAQSPELTLVKTADPTIIANAGSVINYSFRVTNSGNTTVSGVKVVDVFAPAKPNLTVTCPVTSLAPGGATTCTLAYPATQTDVNLGSIENTATATGTAAGNTPVQSTPSSATVTAPADPALTVVKKASPDTVTKIGQVVTYTFQVTNIGNVTISGVGINDTFTAPAGPALVVVCSTTTLDPGNSTTCTGSYTVTPDDFDNGTVKNSAVATGNPPFAPPVTSPPSTVTVITTPLPSIQLKKIATPNDLDSDGVIGLNDTISWTFTVTNTGNVTLTDVAVDDAVAGSITCSAEPLAAGASESCSADVAFVINQVDVDAGRVDNTATVSGTGANGSRVISDPSSTTTPIGGRPSLVLVKSGSVIDHNNDGRVDAGDQISFAFKVTNTGNVTVRGVKVSDPIAGPVTCATDTLAPGAATSCAADNPHEITQRDIDAGFYSNTATASGADPKGATVTSPPSTATVPLPADRQLGLVKSATVTDENNNGVNDTGDGVVWSFVVTNVGTVAVSNITVNDPSAGNIACPRSELGPGQTMTCRSGKHVITAAESARGTLTNTATVTGRTPGGDSVTSPPSSATVRTVGSDAQGSGNPGSGTGVGSGNPGGSANGGGTAFTGVDNLPGMVWLSIWSLLLGMLLLALGISGRRRRAA